MFEEELAGLERPDSTDDGTDTDQSLDDRDARALTECMTTIPLGGNLFSVTTESGHEYTVDARERRCTCPDHEHRDVRCKHLRRVAYATGERKIPSWVSFAAVDPLLGEHFDSQVTTTALADGGTTHDDGGCDGAEEYETGCGDCVRSSDGELCAPCYPCFSDGIEFPDD